MPRRVPIPAELQGVFRADDARRAGVTASRLRSRDVRHPHHGVYATGRAPDELVERCEQLATVLGPTQWFSHVTAARLWGMPLPRPTHPREPLHVIALGDAEPMRRPGVVGWRSASSEVAGAFLGQVPVLSPAATWAQLSVPGAAGERRALSVEWLVAVGDFLLSGRRGHGGRRPLCTLPELTAAAAQRRGGRGVTSLAAALPMLRRPVDSPEETFLRLGLVACGLPEPMVQCPVMTAAGLRHSDLGYPDARVLLEFQGDGHRTSRAQWLEDLTRAQLFQDAGYHLIAVGAADLHPDCRALALRVRRALASDLHPVTHGAPATTRWDRQ